MELLVVLLAIVLLILGLLGSFIPAIPGPPLSYIALLLVSLFTSYTFSQDFLIMWARARMSKQWHAGYDNVG